MAISNVMVSKVVATSAKRGREKARLETVSNSSAGRAKASAKNGAANGPWVRQKKGAAGPARRAATFAFGPSAKNSTPSPTTPTTSGGVSGAIKSPSSAAANRAANERDADEQSPARRLL